MQAAARFAVDALLVSLAFLSAVALALIIKALRRGGRREDPLDADGAIAASRFTPPVSLVVPVDRDAAELSRTVASLLSLNYPQLEVIVIAEPLGAAHMEAFRIEWQLSPKEYFYRRTVATAAVRHILESDRDPRLIVVEKEAAGRADALNCGLSLARFRYVASVAPDAALDSNALLRLTSPIRRDPARVIAATSHVERRRSAADWRAGRVAAWSWSRAAEDWQRIGSIRSWLASRVTWSRLRCGLAPQDAVAVWRRDALIEMGGFSETATDPELDMLVRLQCATNERVSGEIVRTAEIVGWSPPAALAEVARLSGDRQHAVIESLVTLRKAPNGIRGLTATSFLIAELVAPVVQVCAIIALIGGALAGSFSWVSVLLLLALLSFGNAAVTAAALLLRGALANAPTTAELGRLLALAPFEYAIYRPAVALARLTSSH